MKIKAVQLAIFEDLSIDYSLLQEKMKKGKKAKKIDFY